MICAPRQLRYRPMNDLVIRRRIVAHQVHGRPVLLAFLRIQAQPGQSAQLAYLRGSLARAIALYAEQTAAPVPRLPL